MFPLIILPLILIILLFIRSSKNRYELAYKCFDPATKTGMSRATHYLRISHNEVGGSRSAKNSRNINTTVYPYIMSL